jgi:hypothetical protein
MPGVGQEDAAKLARRRGADDLALEAVLDQQRQVSRMIEMRMREEDLLYAGRVDRQLRPIAQPERLEALKQAAVDEQAATFPFEQIFRARHCACGAKEGEFHRHGRTIHNSGRRYGPS